MYHFSLCHGGSISHLSFVIITPSSTTSFSDDALQSWQRYPPGVRANIHSTKMTLAYLNIFHFCAGSTTSPYSLYEQSIWGLSLRVSTDCRSFIVVGGGESFESVLKQLTDGSRKLMSGPSRSLPAFFWREEKQNNCWIFGYPSFRP